MHRENIRSAGKPISIGCHNQPQTNQLLLSALYNETDGVDQQHNQSGIVYAIPGSGREISVRQGNNCACVCTNIGYPADALTRLSRYVTTVHKQAAQKRKELRLILEALCSKS